MRSKKTLILLICSLVLVLILSVQYLKSKREYDNLLKNRRYYLTSNLIQSIGIGNGLDINKVIAGDKESIISLINMYEHVSNSSEILTIDRSDISSLDPLTLYDYKMALKDIVDKSIKGELKTEDQNKLNIITEDINQIYKYINESKKLNENEFYKEVKPKLKLKKPL